MNPRHAAALALVGWYLMYPPLKYGDDPYAVPLGRWLIEQSFDSAQPCEHAKKSMLRKWRNHPVSEEGLDKQTWDSIQPFIPPSTRTEFKGTKIAAQEFAACIATDDPRLAK